MTSFLTPWQWLWLSVRRGASSGAPVFALSLIATALLGAVLVPLLTVSARVDEQRNGSGVLTQIDVTVAEDGSASSLTLDARDRIGALPGVLSVVPDLTVGIYAGGEGTWSTTVRTANPANLPPDIDRELIESLGPNEVIVPSELAGEDLGAFVGSPLPIEYTQARGENEGELRARELDPVGEYDPAWQGYGPGAIVGSETLVASLLAARAGIDIDTYLGKRGVDAVIVTADSDEVVTDLAAALRELGFDARPQRDSLGELPGIVSVFPALFATGGVVVMVLLALLVITVVRTATTRRSAEFGLLRIRGWNIRDVRSLIVLDVGMASAGGSLIGVGTGVAVAAAFGQAPPVTGALTGALAALALAPTLLAVAVGLGATRRALRSDPYLSLVRPG